MGVDSHSRADLSLSAALIPIRARISPFQWRRFPFVRGLVPFNGGDSLSCVDLSLSQAVFPIRARNSPFRKQISPFQRQTPLKKCENDHVFNLDKKGRFL